MYRTLLVVALLAALIAPTPTAAQSGSVTLTGEVHDAETLAPLNGLTVAVPDLSRSTMTDAEGRFVLRDLPAGDFIVTIAGLGYRPFSEMRSIEPGAHLEIGLTPQAIEMEEVVVTIETINDVFRARRNASAYRSQLFMQEDLPMRAFPTARQLVAFQAQVVMCPALGAGPNPAAGIFSTSLQLSMAGLPGCIHTRGRTVPLAVYIDEEFALAGVEALDTYNPAEIYALELRRNGMEVRLFTNQFIERAMKGRRMLSRLPAPPPGGPGG